jgi:uncharacterized membrane protein
MPQNRQEDPAPGAGAATMPEGFHTAMAHLYRAEMQRMTTWRTRLDTTSNWAILLTTGMATFSLGSPSIPHYILLLALALILMCLVIEARRYQHLQHSRWRLGHLDARYLAPMLCGREGCDDLEWGRVLAEDLREPRMTIGVLSACRLRLRHNYLMLVYFSSAVWLAKVFIHPESPSCAAAFYERMRMGELFPSWFVASTAAMFVLGCTALAVLGPGEAEVDRRAMARREAGAVGK